MIESTRNTPYEQNIRVQEYMKVFEITRFKMKFSIKYTSFKAI